MRKMKIRNLLFMCISALIGNSAIAAYSETPIPRSMSGDKGQYFLLNKKKNGNIVQTLHKRVGVDSIGYTKAEINCKTMQIRELGYSEVSPSAIKNNPTNWFEIVAGSSKSDLANFVCSK